LAEPATPQKPTLAYVFVDNSSLLNAEIVKQGYGFALSRYPFTKMEDFRRLEREAREQERGLWNSEHPVNGSRISSGQ
jgi:micrococcal nuclease